MQATKPDTLLEDIFRLSLPQKAGLNKLRLATVRDLLYHLPSRYEEALPVKNISELSAGEKVTVFGKVLSNKIKKAWRKKIPIAEVTLADQTGQIKAVWFHQAYMAKLVPEGGFARVSGTVTDRKGELYLANPIMEKVAGLPQGLFSETPIGELTGIYPESRGISSLWLSTTTRKLLKEKAHEQIPDPIPKEILQTYKLPKLQTALVWIHTPRSQKDALAAQKRFAFEEIFLIQLARQRDRLIYKQNPSFQIEVSGVDIRKFSERFPFELTEAQKEAINVIITDLRRPSPMMRLLEGDVGSGKTAVAAITAYGVVMSRPPVAPTPTPTPDVGIPKHRVFKRQDFGNLQAAYMAPTEVLAKQQFESFIKYFEHLGINIGLITGSECRKFPSKVNPQAHTHISRGQLLRWVANGEIPILVGTHALIEKSVQFKHLAFVIIDEQHRFGVTQRAKLAQKNAGAPTPDVGSPKHRGFTKIAPHLLSMTATPIPRTLALTIFGDLDLTLLDQMPPGRKAVLTQIVEPNKRKEIYEKIRQEIKKGRQAYVICPRIDEPDPEKELALQAKSAKAEATRLQKEIFPEFKVGLLHSKIKPKEKEKIMKEFAEGSINILVATSVVEVGVNVPNATIIVIEGAERFGLAQLHQLRGRVLRSEHQAHCYLFTESKSKRAAQRLEALAAAKNGFELAELDLKLRGPGELSGARQWGISDIGMNALKNLKMVEAARTEAQRLIEKDLDLKQWPLLAQSIKTRIAGVHLE